MNIQSRIGASVTANGRSYRFPQEPTVVVCIDGSEPGYIEARSRRGWRRTSTASCAPARTSSRNR